MNEAEYQKVLREYRRGRTKRYLQSPEFRRDLFSSSAFFGVLAIGILGLHRPVIAAVYCLGAAIAASHYVRKSYDNK